MEKEVIIGYIRQKWFIAWENDCRSDSMGRSELLLNRVNKIWRRYHTPDLQNRAEYEFAELMKNLSEEEKKIAQNCWDKLEKEKKEKTGR